MRKNNKLILPWLPANLENLNKQEQIIRIDSILHINSNPDLEDHMDIVYNSLNLLFDFTVSYKNQTDDELTIQYLGTRLFNSIVSSIKMLLAGYYQGSVIFQRDILEVGFLLDFFLIDSSKIHDWKRSDKQQRFNKYRPSIIRKTLDNRDGFKEKIRNKKYQVMCEYAAHATYPGFKLVAPKKLVNIGPFFDSSYLKFIIQELSMHVSIFTIIYTRHFKKQPQSLLEANRDYLDKLKKWAQKYFKLDFDQKDFNIVKEWMQTISKNRN